MTDVRLRSTPQAQGTSHGQSTAGSDRTLTAPGSATRSLLTAPDKYYRAPIDHTYVAQPPRAAILLNVPRIKPPPSSTTFETARGTQLVHTSLASYAPETTTVKTLPRDPALARYLTSTDTMFPLNAERTDMKELRTELEGWARTQPTVVGKALGRGALSGEQAVAALRHLTPAQAAQLTTAFAADNIEFLQGKPAGPAQAFDSVGVNCLVKDGRGVGVCRNYAETVTTTFGLLKSMQAQPTQLANTYAQQISAFGHRWNAFYTVQPDHSVMTTMTDGVWADGGQLEVNTRGRLYAMQQHLLRQLDASGDDQSALEDRVLEGDVRSLLGLQLPGDGTLTSDEVRASGGVDELVNRFRGLWLPQQADALGKMAPDLRRALLMALQRAGDPQPFTSTPTQKIALY